MRDRGHHRLRVGALSLDPMSREVRLGGESVELSAKEYALLRALAGDPSRVFANDELLRTVWGYRAKGSTRTLDSHACRLRHKLGVAGDRFVINVWGVGLPAGRRAGRGGRGRPRRPRGMKRSPMRRSSALRRGRPLQRRTTLKRTTPMKRGPYAPASAAQRVKVAGQRCVVCSVTGCMDPAHLVPRSLGGCGDPLCVIALCRRCHRAYDRGLLDLVAHLEPRHRAEAADAVMHLGLAGALRRISDTRG